ncbi:sugar ABC transporter permease [Gordoniibacillus kamchatkensis]|uniref:Sugar ABC transporter permease n=1 Tax=Gordoniibacillus kamchatkensis TaxID=1590651 RepID=A0ABR5ADC9_9BACL|nr:carbohydrate ABC transporter permease [Paenibacillus sp. VKM B-2647]KIL39017.1 sugar ABC transporter permease [Paenibacillus sp. VKM B-2647]
MNTSFAKQSPGGKIFDVCNVILLLVFGVLVFYPFINLLALSLNDGVDALKGGIYIWPRKLSLSAYLYLFQDSRLLSSLTISVMRVIIGTTTCVLSTGLLAYIVTVKHFSGRKMMRIVFIITIYFSGGLIPTYLVFLSLGLTNTFNVYWIPAMFNATWMLYMASYMESIPDSLFESARIDGASELGIFVRIAMPVCIPVFASIAVFSSVSHWNYWLDTVIYNSSGNWDTLPIYLKRMLLEVEALEQLRNPQALSERMRDLSPTTLRAAVTMLVTLPIFFVYPIMQRYFIGGITLGAVKG